MENPKKYMDLTELVDFFIVPARESGPAVTVYRILFYNRPNIYDKASFLQQYGGIEQGEKYQKILNQISDSANDPSPESKEFQNQIMFVAGNLAGPVFDSDRFRGQEEQIRQICQIMERSMNMIHDPAVQKKLYQRMAYMVNDNQLKLQYLTRAANNPSATIQDKIELADKMQAQQMDIRPVADDIIKMAQQNLDSEFKQKIPNLENIKQTSNEMQWLANMLQYKHPEMSKSISEKFNMDAILASPEPAQYIPQYDKSLESKLADAMAAQQQNAAMSTELARVKVELERMRQENEKLTTEKSQLTQDLNAQRAALEQLRGQNAQLESEKQNLGQNRESMNEKMRQILEATKKLKAGFGSSGINEMKQLVERLAAEHE